jgi:aspartate--ammonia ligase
METITKEKIEKTTSLKGWRHELAIAQLKEVFTKQLSEKLQLFKVEAPLIVEKGTGINDDLNGIESPVSVHVKNLPGISVEIVHSLAKWKRLKLGELSIDAGHGIYTDMKALRPDEDFSVVHSIFVDQWDWEKVILKENRNLTYLKKTVAFIYDAILATENYITALYPELKPQLPKEIYFIHTEELQALYPDLSPKERENEICKSKGAVFLIGIGGELADGKKHDGRAPDYDDWSTVTENGKKGLNGDILVWNKTLNSAFEISSMGIRVDETALDHQLKLTGEEKRLSLNWHQKLMKGELPYTIGGGIGQSRLAMLLLQKQHIGEVQASIWPKEVREKLEKQQINLL